MKRVLACLFLPVILCLSSPSVLRLVAAPEKISASTNPYVLTTWNLEDGLPQQSILCLLQSANGYIWFGTQAGLVRFDGSSCRVFNRWNNNGLKNDRILSLYEDSSGVLWVGMDGGGLAQFKEESWASFTTQQGLSNDTVRAICGDHQQHLWVGTDSGLNEWVNGELKPFPWSQELMGTAITALTVDQNDTLWIGTGSNGLFRLQEGKILPVPFGPGLPSNTGAISALLVDKTGIMWVGTEKGLFSFQQDYLQAALPWGVGTPHPLAEASIKALLEDRDGSIWVGTEGEGLFRRFPTPPHSFSSVSSPQGLLDDFIYSLLQDHEGNLWLGTYTTGLLQLKSRQGEMVTTTHGLPENTLLTVLAAEEGFLWVGTLRHGAVKFDLKNQQVVQQISTLKGLSGNRVNTLWLDQDKTLLVGTTTGLNRIVGEKIQVYNTGNGLSHPHITAIHRTRNHTLWVGTTRGLNRWSEADQTFSVFPPASLLHQAHIRALYENQQCILWIGTRQGLFMLDANNTILPIPEVTDDILSIYQDSGGHLWLGTNGSGLLELENTPSRHLTAWTTAHGLPDNYIFSISGDTRPYLWCTSYRGVFRLALDTSNSLRQSPEPRSTPTETNIVAALLENNDGGHGSQCAMGGHPAASLAPNGKLYVPTSNGLSILDTLSLHHHLPPPPVRIENVFVDNLSVFNGVHQKEPLVIPVGNHIIEFYFTAISFTSPGSLRIRYKLEGFDSQWHEIPPYRRRSAVYLNLPAGDYVFTVSACGSNGLWTRTNPRFLLQIRRPLYQHPIFIILLLLVLFTLGLGGFFLWRRARRRVLVFPAKPLEKAPAFPEEEKAVGKEKYKTSALLPETVDAVLPALTGLMEKEKLFLDPRLNLKSLSIRLNVHYNHLSRIINEQMGKSFNDYINSYRIEEAKKRLADPSPVALNKTVLEIAYDTGFYSKSVFNTAFKKFSGMTPSQYRKEQHPHHPKGVNGTEAFTDEE